MNKDQKVGPDIHTHQAGAVDSHKTIVRNETAQIEEATHGHGIYDEEYEEHT
ncbi:hypothetical protein [Marinicrinis lubricantis]|uniref:DUF4025 domain-containing protein n=1 Tax=Marinicrinis lubricantis TaxID=2086470 RepID=A0ABW1IK14_9BACL